jgi:hypothetical protein
MFSSLQAVLAARLTEAIYKYFFEKHPKLRQKYADLMEKYFMGQTPSPQTAIFFEREAVVLSLQLSGMYPSYKGRLAEKCEDTPSFLSNIESARTREDIDIIHDAHHFKDWQKVADSILSTATFTNGRKVLTIMYVNRTPIEENLGVDLIYIDEMSTSFIMVQYKRLIKETKRYAYRPDADPSYGKEIELMERFLRVLSDQTKPHTGYRYNDDVFYFKLCKELQTTKARSLADGMYIPLSYWKHLYSDRSTLGPSGGRIYSYESVRNYLNNTTFVNMVQTGLVGSRVEDFTVIGDILRDIVESGRSVILSTLGNA